MSVPIPASLKFTVPLILLGFAATLSAINLLYYVPKAELAAEEDGRKRLAQEMSRLQSTLEYLVLKGDMAHFLSCGGSLMVRIADRLLGIGGTVRGADPTPLLEILACRRAAGAELLFLCGDLLLQFQELRILLVG